MVPKVLHVAVGHILCIFHVCLLFQCGPILIIDFKSSHNHMLKPCLKVNFLDGLCNDFSYQPSPCKFQFSVQECCGMLNGWQKGSQVSPNLTNLLKFQFFVVVQPQPSFVVLPLLCLLSEELKPSFHNKASPLLNNCTQGLFGFFWVYFSPNCPLLKIWHPVFTSFYFNSRLLAKSPIVDKLGLTLQFLWHFISRF